jgi:hypothetical protein
VTIHKTIEAEMRKALAGEAPKHIGASTQVVLLSQDVGGGVLLRYYGADVVTVGEPVAGVREVTVAMPPHAHIAEVLGRANAALLPLGLSVRRGRHPPHELRMLQGSRVVASVTHPQGAMHTTVRA